MLRFDTPTARLRLITFVEGLSYLVLLFVAMPLKYLADQPLAGRVGGSLHGLLFVLRCLMLLRGLVERDRSLGWAVRIFVAALIPFGTFFLDRGLAAEDAAFRAEQAAPPG